MHGIRFLDSSMDSSNFLTGSYNYGLIFLSVVIACLAAYAALGFVERTHTANDKSERWAWLVAGAGVMGLGIWSMHFVGMLAYRLPLQITYDVSLTLLSILPAVFASLIALLVISRKKPTRRTIVGGAVCMGAGIGAMHYSGMAAMQVSADMYYHPLLFVGSLFIAVFFSAVSLYVNLLAERSTLADRTEAILRASLFMGCAISGMHYTGMSAARWVPNGVEETLRLGIGSLMLSTLVVLVTLLILGLAIVMALVDKRIRSADYLRELSETRYRSLYESMRDSAILLNFNSIVDCNTTTLTMFGYDSKDELCGEPSSRLSPPTQPCGGDSNTLMIDNLSRAVAAGSEVINWVHRRRDGSDFHAEIALNAVEIEGEMLFQAIVRDDTERLRAEEELRASEQIKSAILESALDCIITLDHRGRIIDFNPTAEKTFGYSHDQVAGERLSDKIFPPVFRKMHELELRQYLQTGESAALSKRIEISAMRSDGSEFRAELAIAPIRNHGSPLFTAYVRDITKHLKHHEALQAANEEALRLAHEAEEANQAKSIFLANMSHEIRTPMNAILGFTEILSGRIHDPQQRDYLNSIQTSAKVFLGLINDILDLSKVEAGGLEIKSHPVDIHALGDDIRAIFEQQVTEKGLEFTVETDPEIRNLLMLDEQHMRQIMVNLVGNAIKFTDEGSVRLQVEADHDNSTDESVGLVITVADTGVGIAENQIDAVFGIFAQQKGQCINKYGGTGLGLSISKRLVELMGGEISVHSQVDAGSIFRVVIRDIAIAASDEIEAMDQAPVDAKKLLFEPATVLIADVIGNDRKLVKAYLEGHNFTLLEAEDGEQAMDLVSRERPDLVLMDTKMPVVDGFEVMQRIKADEELQDIPVIVITAPTMKETESKVRAVCDGYLRKPISKQKLITTIAQFLPHDSVERQEESTPNLAARAESGPRPISGEALQRLPALLEVLQHELETTWTELRGSGNINKLEVFAGRVAALGREYDYSPLSEWAARLKNNTSLFQVDRIPVTMKELPGVANELEELTANELRAESA